MNRRTQGRVRQAQRRANKRAAIRAGRVMSVQQILHHQHHQAETPVPAGWDETATGATDAGTHMLVNNETGQELQRGTEHQMRKQRAISLEASPEGSFSVRKVK